MKPEPPTAAAAPPDRSATRSVALVSMPWSLLGAPSIQIGTLTALCARAGLATRAHSFHLELVDFEAASGGRDPFGIEDYRAVADRFATAGAGEWVFAIPPVRAPSRAKDEAMGALLRQRGMPRALWRKLERLRERIPLFLEHCADEILEARPAAVGFTTTYAQTLASLALASVLRRRDPSLAIVLGGAGCEGEMGEALLARFPWVDHVLRGEGEEAGPALLGALARGEEPPDLPGLCSRKGSELRLRAMAGPSSEPMDSLPLPDYGEYFARLSRSRLAGALRPEIPFESARGCWWGAKHHCTFCGLNGTTMKFRSKSPGRVREELLELARRHEVLDFTAVDNIIDMGYFGTLLPELASSRYDFSLFYETKANLSREQVRELRAAGVRTIQPGIESLSSEILALMKKGVAAWQNVRLLKWASEEGIGVVWNLLHGFPGERPQEYARMAELVPALVHLPPPRLGALVIDRFSPYHVRPAELGLELGDPLPWYRALYDAEGEELARLAYSFEARRSDGLDSALYVQPLAAAIELWNREAPRNRGALVHRRGPGFVTIVDRRSTLTPAQYTLEGAEAELYLALDAGATRGGIEKQLARSGIAPPSAARVEELLAELCDARLVLEEEGRFLSLSLPAR